MVLIEIDSLWGHQGPKEIPKGLSGQGSSLDSFRLTVTIPPGAAVQISEKQAVKQLGAIASGLSSVEQRGKSPNLSWKRLPGQYSAWLSAPWYSFLTSGEPGSLLHRTGLRRHRAGPVLTAHFRPSQVLYLAPRPTPAFRSNFEK